ncbi:MAG: hypothetical protein P8L83_08350 [Flavobacteriaceae bacterium]|nr:hypothetical protein [Flavobacteriaceae bacterium]
MKITKYLIILISPLFIFSQASNEKNDKEQRFERMESRKIAFISDKVELSPDKAQVFWPIYNKYNSEIKSVRDSSKSIIRNYNNNKSFMSNDELGKVIDAVLKIEQRYLEIKIKYVKDFHKIISNKQIIELHQAEESFKRELLRRIKKGERKTSDFQFFKPKRNKLSED